MADLEALAVDVAEHMLAAVDNAIPTDPTPEQLHMLALAYVQIVTHAPRVKDVPKSVGRATRHSSGGPRGYVPS